MESLIQQADVLFRQGEKQRSIVCYEQALDIAKKTNNSQMEEMILVGLGFALTNSSDASDIKNDIHIAREFERGLQCLTLARNMSKNSAAVVFLDRLIESKGKIQASACSHEKSAPCSSGGFLTEDPEIQALIDIVAKEGAGQWNKKALTLHNILKAKDEKNLIKSAKYWRSKWELLAPELKQKLATNPDMPCGHTCQTCPTKASCQLHDALELDIEDLAKISISSQVPVAAT